MNANYRRLLSILFSITLSIAVVVTLTMALGLRQAAPSAMAQEIPGEIPDANPDIIGGQEAVPGAWPWMAALVQAERADAFQGQFCAGSLIADRWILTAAHCTYEIESDDTQPNGVNFRPLAPDEVDVVLGRHELSASDGERLNVIRILRHPDYDERDFDFDVALLQLERASAYQAIALNRPDNAAYSQHEAAGTLSTVVGWGAAAFFDYVPLFPDGLREVSMPVVSNSVCRDAFGLFTNSITGNMLCLGFNDAEHSACNGDSGGPTMVYDEASQQWFQIGVVSWGRAGCAVPEAYSVFARVSALDNWIAEQVPNLVTRADMSTATPTSTPTSTASPPPVSTPLTPVPTPSPTPTAVPTATPVRVQLPIVSQREFSALRNAGFEESSSGGWRSSSLSGRPLLFTASQFDLTAHDGSRVALLGGANGEIAKLTQTLTIPRGTPRLRFWYQLDSREECSPSLGDYGGVVVDLVVVDKFELCQGARTTDWTTREVDLSDYAGRVVSLQLRVETDGSTPSLLFLDDVSFIE